MIFLLPLAGIVTAMGSTALTVATTATTVTVGTGLTGLATAGIVAATAGSGTVGTSAGTMATMAAAGMKAKKAVEMGSLAVKATQAGTKMMGIEKIGSIAAKTAVKAAKGKSTQEAVMGAIRLAVQEEGKRKQWEELLRLAGNQAEEMINKKLREKLYGEEYYEPVCEAEEYSEEEMDALDQACANLTKEEMEQLLEFMEEYASLKRKG